MPPPLRVLVVVVVLGDSGGEGTLLESSFCSELSLALGDSVGGGTLLESSFCSELSLALGDSGGAGPC